MSKVVEGKDADVVAVVVDVVVETVPFPFSAPKNMDIDEVRL